MRLLGIVAVFFLGSIVGIAFVCWAVMQPNSRTLKSLEKWSQKAAEDRRE